MNAASIIERLAHFGRAPLAVSSGLKPEELCWRPPSGNWSIVEVLCHLADEEVEDFRTRLAFVIQQREGTWPAIDPEGWAISRRYIEQDAAAVAERFALERERSVAWLREIEMHTDWSLAYQHPRFGPIPAGALLASWAAHDALHLRQIAKRLHEMAGRDGGAYQTVYAGEWHA